MRATESALKRLKTNRIDLLQLHNIRMEQVSDDMLWETLEKLRERGLVRYYGIARGPAIGWQYEGINCVRERTVRASSTSTTCLSNIQVQLFRTLQPCLGEIRCS